MSMQVPKMVVQRGFGTYPATDAMSARVALLLLLLKQLDLISEKAWVKMEMPVHIGMKLAEIVNLRRLIQLKNDGLLFGIDQDAYDMWTCDENVETVPLNLQKLRELFDV